MSARLLLVGGGHAQLSVLAGLAQGALRPTAATLVAPHPGHLYSGMLPGVIGGRYAAEEATLDLAALARHAGCDFVEGTAAALDPVRRLVTLADGRRIGYDVVSLAVGSGPPGLGLPGVAERAAAVRPIDRGLAIVPAVTRLARERSGGRIVVAGAGAAGLEVALAIRARGRRLDAGDLRITVVDADRRILADHPAAARLAAAALRRHRIGLRLGAGIAAADDEAVRLDDGTHLPCDLLVWAAGAEAPAWLRASGLPVDERGWLRVDTALRSLGDPRVFAAGDAAALPGPPLPKAGVYAVRQGPVLRDNLAAALRGSGRMRRYVPQRRFLALLDTGDDSAILSYGPVALAARWALRLKTRIDRRFIARYRTPPGPPPGPPRDSGR